MFSYLQEKAIFKTLQFVTLVFVVALMGVFLCCVQNAHASDAVAGETQGVAVEQPDTLDSGDPQQSDTPENAESADSSSSVNSNGSDAQDQVATTEQPEGSEQPATSEKPSAPVVPAVKTEAQKMDELAAANKRDDGTYADGLVNKGVYLINYPKSTNKVVEVKAGSKKNNANVISWSSNMTKGQQWKVIRDAKGYVSFVNVVSGKALAVAGAKAKSGTNVVQATYKSTKREQKWVVMPYKAAFKLMSALGHNLCLHVTGGSTKDGANVCIQTSSSAAAQRFIPLRVDGQHVAPHKKLSSIDKDAWYEIATDSRGKMVLDVAGASTSNGANVGLWNKNGNLCQLYSFSFVKTSGKLGYYRIAVANSGKVLDVQNGNLVPGTNIQIYKKTGSLNQLWAIYANEDGSHTLVSAATGIALGSTGVNAGANVYTASSPLKVSLIKRNNLIANGVYSLNCASKPAYAVDINGASTKEGARALIWTYVNGYNQKWCITAVEGLDNVYTIESINSAMLLAASSKKAGATIKQKTATGSKLQRWVPTIVSGGSVVFANYANQGVALGMAGSKVANGTKLQLSANKKAKAQRFRVQEAIAVEKGFYFITGSHDSNVVFNVVGASKKNSARVGTASRAPKGHQGNQKWQITVNGDGTLSIANCLSEKLMTVKKAKSGASVIQYKANGSKGQQWRAEYVPGTRTYRFVSVLDPNYVLEASTGGDGGSVVLGKRQDSDMQRFGLEKTTYTTLTPEQQAMANRIMGMSSSTNYIIAVDTMGCRTGVFKGSKGNWKLVRYEACATGAPGSDTIKGTYTINYHEAALSAWPNARYCTHITGEYFFHSILSSTSELGHRISHGCIRLNWPYAQYMQTLPYGSKVHLY